jgi:hypothetical protein
MYVTPILFRESAFGFAGMDRCRVSPRVAGRGPAFFTLSREEFNNLKSQIVTSSRVSSWIVCDIRGNLKGLGYDV